MTAKTGVSAVLTGMIFAASGAAADDFDFEIGAAFQRTSLDAEQTITTPGGSIFNSNDVDTDAYDIFGSWFFAGLSDDKGPRARAAFVDRASVLSLGIGRTEVSFAASVVSTDPLIPSFDGSFDTDADAYVLDVRYVWRDSGWFADAGVAHVETSIGGVVGGSGNSTAWRLGVGKYLFETTTLALDVSQADEDGGDATNYSATFSHLGDMGADWQYAVDLGYSQTDSDFDLDVDTWSAALSLYPNRDVEFGVRVTETDADFAALDSTSYEGFLGWFATPNVELAASYRVDDVGFLGNVAVGGAPTNSDADQDGIGLGVTVRF